MRTLFLSSLLLAAMASCHKDDLAKGAPECLNKQITDFKSIACSTGATAKEYTFQNQTVYVLDPGPCGADMTSNVLNNSCTVLGTLGGIAGNTRVNGEDFSNAIFVRTVWEN